MNTNFITNPQNTKYKLCISRHVVQVSLTNVKKSREKVKDAF